MDYLKQTSSKLQQSSEPFGYANEGTSFASSYEATGAEDQSIATAVGDMVLDLVR